MRQLAVIGEQQQSGGIHVKPADHDPTSAARRGQVIEHRGAALRVTARGHFTHGLVVQQYLRGIALAAQVQWPAVQADTIGTAGAITQYRDAVVDGHATGTDPFLYATPGAMARA